MTEVIDDVERNNGSIEGIINYAEKHNLDVKYLKNGNYDYDQAWFILQGLLDPMYNVEEYAKPEYSSEQMYQIMRGQEHGIDYEPYLNPKLSALQMMTLREAIEDGIDVSSFNDPSIDYKDMYRTRIKIAQGV
ncbi:MAG: hypothetical protein IIT65_12720 [Lachnospiraceae bacterium]|nr:hypothetical protein [Lachnospiraceae bacterium]